MFTQLGLPTAFVGMVLIALIFINIHQKVSWAAAIIAVFLVGVYGLIQRKQAVTGDDIDIAISNPEADAFQPNRHLPLHVSVIRGQDTLVISKSLDAPSFRNLQDGLKRPGLAPGTRHLGREN